MSEQVRLVAGLRFFYVGLLTDGFCVIAVIVTKTCSAQIVGRNTALM